MLRFFFLQVTKMDKIRNEHIRGTTEVSRFGGKKLESADLDWSGHVQRTNGEYICRNALSMALPGKRARGRGERRLMDVVREGCRQ